MSKENFKLLQQSNSKEEILALNDILKKNGIETKLINSTVGFQGGAMDALVGDNIQTYAIHIPQEKFNESNKILEDAADNQVKQINSNHYLFQFTNEELYDILKNRNEWSHIDYALAKKILKDRGEEINQEKLEKREKNPSKIFNEKNISPISILIVGYTSAIGIPILGLIALPYLRKIEMSSMHRVVLTFWAIIGTPILGLWIAYLLTKSTINYNGQETYLFDERSVYAGRIINILAWMFLIFFILLDIKTGIISSYIMSLAL